MLRMRRVYRKLGGKLKEQLAFAVFEPAFSGHPVYVVAILLQSPFLG
jgi:hypothetical protein